MVKHILLAGAGPYIWTRCGILKSVLSYFSGVRGLRSVGPFEVLARKAGSEKKAKELLSELALGLGLNGQIYDNKALCVLELCELGTPPEEAAKLLGWEEFEEFCANLFRVAGYRVQLNIFLRRPRRQLDFVATSESICLSVDCKHWDKSLSYAALSRQAKAQLSRSAMLKQQFSIEVPIVSVLVTLSQQETRFLDGVAIVPLLSLRSFLSSIESFQEHLIQV
jgi:hypothetical protein